MKLQIAACPLRGAGPGGGRESAIFKIMIVQNRYSFNGFTGLLVSVCACSYRLPLRSRTDIVVSKSERKGRLGR